MAEKVMLAGAFPTCFEKEIENKCGVETFIVERDVTQGYNEEAIEKFLNQKDGCIIFGVREDKGESRQATDHVTQFLWLSRIYETGQCNFIPVKFSSNGALPEALAHLKSLEYSTDNEFWDSILDRMKNPVPVEQLLPVGNVAHGLIQNYLYGYLKRIMTTYPGLYKNWLSDRSRREEDHVKGCDKLIILLPTSCSCKPLLSAYDSCLTCMKEDPVEKRMNRAGQEKFMVQAVYKIQHGDQTYMVMLEVPNIITTISKLVGREGTSFTQEQVPEQFRVFRQYLEEALDFQEDLRDHYLLVEFPENDPKLQLGELIVQHIEKDKKAETQKVKRAQSKYDYDINIVAEDPDDKELQKTMTHLKEHKLTVFLHQADRTMGSGLQEQNKEISKSKRTVLWIDSTIKGEEQKVSYYEIQEIQERQKRGVLLPVVKGSSHTLGDRYQFIQRSNHLYSTEPLFLEKLLEAAKGETPLTYPLGDIATGLVWTYCLNYLEQNLSDYVKSYKKTLAYDKESVLFPYFICLIPKSCFAPGKIIEYDSTIERMTDDYKEEILFIKTVSGVERKYNAPVNKVHYNGKVYKVLCEFCTPLAALADMEKGMKTQLSLKHKLQQRTQFDELLRHVIASGTQRNRPLKYCKLLPFDDEFEDQTSRKEPKFNLSKRIAELVENNNEY